MQVIITKEGDGDYKKGLIKVTEKKWLIGNGEHDALDYKIKFLPISVLKSIPITYSKTKDGKFRPEFPTIFGNISNESEKKFFCFCETQNVVITSFSSELRKAISQYISKFFFENNFGFRQSKGFGSYSIGDFAHDENISNLFFKLNHPSNEFKKLFGEIDLFYRCLKSGINIKTKIDNSLVDKMYFKSLMFKYAKELPIPEQWDKRTLRHGLYINDPKYKKDSDKTGVYYRRTNLDGTVKFNTTKPTGRDYYDFRDLLGLSTEQDWLAYTNKKLVKKVTKPIIVDDQDETLEIERFQSPILIKPYYGSDKQWYIYLLLSKIPENYLSSNVEATAGPNSTQLLMYPKFNLPQFLHFAINNFNKNDIEYGKGFTENEPEAKTIIDIFSQLKQKLSKSN